MAQAATPAPGAPAPNMTWPERREFRPDQELRSGAVVVHPSFHELVGGDPADVELTTHYTGTEWAEGPAWVPARDGADGFLVFSDVPNNRMLKFDPASGVTSIYRAPSHFSNGNSIDNDGRLVTCEHLRHAVVRQELDGTMTTLADRYDGGRLNSPNDLCVKSDGSIWFTDPPYGILSDREGAPRPSEQAGNHVYRLDPDTGDIAVATSDLDRPNGIAFSPDERTLYVADSGAPQTLVAFDVGADGSTLANARAFAVVRPGIADGFRTDVRGNVWTSAHDGAHCYNASGVLIGKLLVPEQRTANCAFGDDDMQTLYIAADTSLYSVRLAVVGTR